MTKLELPGMFSFEIEYEDVVGEYYIHTKGDTGVSIVWSAKDTYIYLHADNPNYPKPSLTGRQAIEFLKLGQLLLDHQASLHPSVILD